MTKQIHTTANGKTVDMGALRLKNERTRSYLRRSAPMSTVLPFAVV